MFSIPNDHDVVTRISASDLQDGDVLLYQGTSLLSRLIREFDGSQYSHAAIVHSGRVVEALGDGINARDVITSIGSAKVDAYRFIKDGHKLLDTEYPIAPLDAAMGAFEADPERYAYEQILLLAVLCSTRKLTAIMHEPALAKIVRNLLDSASDVIARTVAMGREPVICSELVYRCYANADGDKYNLLIRGADVAMEIAGTTAPDVPEAAEMRLQALDFLANYSAAKRASRVVHATPTAPSSPGPATVAELLTAAAIADFVTPHDLEMSPDLQLAGTVSLV